MKKCSNCKIKKPLVDFYKDKSTKDGHRHECKECGKKYSKKYNKDNKEKINVECRKYYGNNKEKMNARNKKYYEKNKKEIIDRAKKYNKENKLKKSIYMKEWRNNNKEKIELQRDRYAKTEKGRESIAKSNAKILSTPEGKINNSISNGIRHSLKNKKHRRHWEKLVGYTLQQLMDHLESQFEFWMTWDNYGNNKYSWSIDHIKPISSFSFKSYDDEKFKKCWALENLRPLDHIENLRKNNKII